MRRRRHVARHLDSTHVEIDGKTYVNFASNDYLGLSHHPRLIEGAAEAARRGTGSGSAPLVCGYTEDHAAAEKAIADWKQVEGSVLLPSGYQANHAAIGAVAGVSVAAGRKVRFLLDKLVHASLLDAVRATEMPFRVFPHNGVDKLGRLLADADQDELQVVVTESIFSMDGDAADLESIAKLKREHSFVLVLDEAHASGVYGPDGRGYAASVGLSQVVDLSIVTLSKALGGIGGAVCGSRNWCEGIVNFGRAYLFSTAVPPSACATAVAAIDVCRGEPHRRQKVLALAARMRSELHAAGAKVPGGNSPIIPIILGEESAALSAAERLRDAGLFVPAIRPPTVPRSSSRLRVTLNCEHTDAEIERLIRSLISIKT